ncbi:MAG: hypothetical protein V4632_20635 [Pseudomonadota bacterium]
MRQHPQNLLRNDILFNAGCVSFETVLSLNSNAHLNISRTDGQANVHRRYTILRAGFACCAVLVLSNIDENLISIYHDIGRLWIIANGIGTEALLRIPSVVILDFS